jgi:DNA topoisomerase-6 subunit A
LVDSPGPVIDSRRGLPRAKTSGDKVVRQIVDYDLPTHILKDVDVKRAKDALKNDPFFKHYDEWAGALEQLLKMGRRAEQQAFAKFDLNFVIDRYLPEKLRHPERFLP